MEDTELLKLKEDAARYRTIKAQHTFLLELSFYGNDGLAHTIPTDEWDAVIDELGDLSGNPHAR